MLLTMNVTIRTTPFNYIKSNSNAWLKQIIKKAEKNVRVHGYV